MKNAFSSPQRQSRMGILLIFGRAVYKALRGLWPLGAYLLFGRFGKLTSMYILVGMGFLFLMIFIFSVVAYRRFRFYIDYPAGEFILQKGVFKKSQFAVPFDKIQQVYFKRSILQRLVNVYEVIIDTAGSKASEVKIKALSKGRADKLRQILMEESKTGMEGINTGSGSQVTDNPVEERDRVVWSHRLRTGTLLRLGLSTNYLRGVWILLIFCLSLFQQFNADLLGNAYAPRVEALYTEYINPDYLLQGFLILLPLVFVVGLLITCIEIFIKYYNLSISRTAGSLELEMGLRTNTRVSIQPRRVQVFRIITNPVQRRLNLYEVQLSLANSIANAAKSRIKIPGLHKEIVEHVQHFLYPQELGETRKKFTPNALLFYRKFMISVIPLLIGIALWSYIMDFFHWKTLLPVILMYGAAAGIYQWYLYRSIALTFTTEFLIFTKGVWTKKIGIIPLFKLQSITVKQPLWYKNRNLYNLTFHTAGGDLAFDAVHSEVLSYINYAIYKVEISSRAWM